MIYLLVNYLLNNQYSINILEYNDNNKYKINKNIYIIIKI
jgi:hypothetical protein